MCSSLELRAAIGMCSTISNILSSLLACLRLLIVTCSTPVIVAGYKSSLHDTVDAHIGVACGTPLRAAGNL